MSVTLQNPITPDAFFHWEERIPRRGEHWSANTVSNDTLRVPEVGIELDFHDIHPG